MTKKSFREKINRDDGKHYQIGNRNLNVKEVIGYAFLVSALLVYLLVSKAGFTQAWLGWSFCGVGVIFIILGAQKNARA